MKKAKIVFFIVGCLILFMLFRTFGIETVIGHIREMGWRFCFIVGIFFFNHLVLTLTWMWVINYPREKLSFLHLFLARIAGDSTASISSLGSMAGEPLKALFIRDRVPFEIGLVSVVLDRTIHAIANMLIIITGIFLGFFVLDIPAPFLVLAFGVFAGILFAMAIILKKQKDGLLAFIISWLPKKITDRFMNERRRAKIKELDYEIGYIYATRENRRTFFKSLFLKYTTILIAGTAEIYLILGYIGKDVTPLHAFFVYVFAHFLTSAVFFMPANVGTSEGAYSMVLKFLGYDPALGLSVGIIRRLRTFVWAGIGIAILFYAGLLKKEVIAEPGGKAPR